ncbi:ankyrin repeat domain-containing protein [Aliikangiella sp. G2MR2-5]|uniref:ankyrin repeat domain-containing protein n=1 Tax=Aliikangiella sp. G2MR2-5 TaxID=2788943 RepID=UPI0018AA560D|nr:ankyrin repeat domain-containing protein [Aliikangiella sp. G2MR2-5]
MKLLRRIFSLVFIGLFVVVFPVGNLVAENEELSELTEHERELVLLVAAKQGRLDLVKELVEFYKVDVDFSYGGAAAIHYAVSNEYEDILKFLIDKGANIYQKTSQGLLPIQLAIIVRSLKCMELLLKAEKKIVHINNSEETLRSAYIAKNLQAIALLLSYNYDPNTIIDGYSLLYLSIATKQIELFDELLRFKTDVNLISENGSTPLVIATVSGNEYVIKTLLEKGADPNIKDINGFTALMHAIRLNNLQTIKSLVRNGADINIKDESGYTALHHAALLGEISIVDYLLKNGADAAVVGDDGASAQEFIDVLKEKIKEN